MFRVVLILWYVAAISVVYAAVATNRLRAEDRKIIRNTYGERVGTITQDPVFREKEVIRNNAGERKGSVEKERR